MVAEEIARQVAGCMPKKGRRGSGLGSRRKRTDTGTRERSKDWKPELPESKRARAPKTKGSGAAARAVKGWLHADAKEGRELLRKRAVARHAGTVPEAAT